MKEIVLVNSTKICKVDDDDYDRLNEYKWSITKTYDDDCKFCYARSNSKRCEDKMMHREIIDIPYGLVIDHIDGDWLNNQKSNLRAVTRRQNSLNRHVKSAHPYPGIHPRSGGRWEAVICVHKISRKLGVYDSAEKAHSVYMTYVRIADYAVTNVVKECIAW